MAVASSCRPGLISGDAKCSTEGISCSYEALKGILDESRSRQTMANAKQKHRCSLSRCYSGLM